MFAKEPDPGNFAQAALGLGSMQGPTTTERPFRSARREQRAASAGLERRMLIWLAQHTPSRINSDHLTLLGSISMFLAGASYALARQHPAGFLLATLFLGLNWLGDSLDGTLARVRRRERPRYGFYVDHILDTFGALFIMGGFAISGYVSLPVAAGMLMAFLMLSIEVYLSTYSLGVFRLSFLKFGPTEVRIFLAAASLVLWHNPEMRVFGTCYRLLDFGGCVAIAGMVVILVISVGLHVCELYREERLP
jgi:phosphatidylglycerophosphate synthase